MLVTLIIKMTTCSIISSQFEEILESSHCALPMGLNTEELLNTKFFCSSSLGSCEALHAVWLPADTVLKNCSSSYFAPPPRMQQGCGAGHAHVGQPHERSWLGTALQGNCAQPIHGQGAAPKRELQTRLIYTAISVHSKVSQLRIGVGTVTGHKVPWQEPKYQ